MSQTLHTLDTSVWPLLFFGIRVPGGRYRVVERSRLEGKLPSLGCITFATMNFLAACIFRVF